MVEFVSLLLSLAFGPTTVELAVAGEVAAVVLELERTTHLLNLYRPPAAVDYVLHRNSKGWLTKLGLSWESRARARSGRFAVSVDGRAVEAADASEVWVPPLDPAETHVLEVVVEYSDGSVARDWIGFGGPTLSEGSAYLTPLQAELPEDVAAADFAARSASDGKPITVVTVEQGDSEIIFVRDGGAAQAADSLVPGRRVSGALSGARDAQAARVIHAVPLRDHEWVRILDSSAARSAARRLDPHSLEMPLAGDQPGNFGLLWHLRAREPDAELGPAWTADAVAIGASRLASGGRRGAMVLVLSAASADRRSVLGPEAVSGYLTALGVPLEVWYLGKATKARREWGEPTEVRSVGGLEVALDELRAALERRGVVWVEGLHLPGEVVLESRPK